MEAIYAKLCALLLASKGSFEKLCDLLTGLQEGAFSVEVTTDPDNPITVTIDPESINALIGIEQAQLRLGCAVLEGVITGTVYSQTTSADTATGTPSTSVTMFAPDDGSPHVPYVEATHGVLDRKCGVVGTVPLMLNQDCYTNGETSQWLTPMLIDGNDPKAGVVMLDGTGAVVEGEFKVNPCGCECPECEDDKGEGEEPPKGE